jgi:hypothetical protein
MFGFKNYVVKIMSKYPRRCVLRFQGKLKLTYKISAYSKLFVIFFSVIMYQSSADFGCRFRLKRKSRNAFDISVSTKSVCFLLLLWRRGSRLAAPTPWVRLCMHV